MKKLLLIPLILLFSIPYLLNFEPSLIQWFLHKKYEKKINIERVQFGWLGDQEITGVTANDLHVKKVVFRGSFINFLFRSPLSRLKEIDGQYQGGTFHFQLKPFKLKVDGIHGINLDLGDDMACKETCSADTEDFEVKTGDFYVKIKQLQVNQVDVFASLLDVRGNWKGTNFSLNIENKQFNFKADGPEQAFFAKGRIIGGRLLLNQPLQAELRPPFKHGEVAITAADSSFKLSIQPEDFSLDLFPLNINVRHFVLTPGKNAIIEWEGFNGWETTLGISNDVQFWSTPVYGSISNGLVQLNRFDFIVNNAYPMALWGYYDAAKDKFKMTLGLTGTTLKRAFRVGNVPKNHILQVPIRGSLQQIHIESSKMGSKLGVMIAQMRNTPQGLLFGGLLKLVQSSLGEGSIPKPTTVPLPWEQPS